jgi:hypothetical protein
MILKKMVSLGVILSFLFLLQVSVMPLSATDGMGAVERSGGAPAGGEKKSIVPILLIGLGVAAVAAVLVFVVFKTKYDIRGHWDVSRTLEGSATPFEFTIDFTGEMKEGTFTSLQAGNTLTGTYTVDKKDVYFIFGPGGSEYWGKFTGKDSMEGTTKHVSGKTGNWTATRGAGAPASVKAPSGKEPIDR